MLIPGIRKSSRNTLESPLEFHCATIACTVGQYRYVSDMGPQPKKILIGLG